MTRSDTLIKLLLVDDSIESAEQIISILRNGGIAVRPARAGNDAEATAELVLRAADQRPSFDITQFLRDAKVKVGAFHPGGHRTPGGKVTSAV